MSRYITENEILYKNDKIIKRLLQLKSERYPLSFLEKRKFKKYQTLFPYNEDENFVIDHIVLRHKLIEIETERDANGDFVSEKRWINENGLKALKKNYYESEISAITKNTRYRKFTIANALIVIILTGASVWLERTNSAQKEQLSKFEKELALVKIKYDTLATYIKDIKTQIDSSKLKTPLQRKSSSPPK